MQDIPNDEVTFCVLHWLLDTNENPIKVQWIKASSFLFQIIQFLNQGRDYFSLDNLLEWAVYVLAIVYVADDFMDYSKGLTFTR